MNQNLSLAYNLSLVKLVDGLVKSTIHISCNHTTHSGIQCDYQGGETDTLNKPWHWVRCRQAHYTAGWLFIDLNLVGSATSSAPIKQGWACGGESVGIVFKRQCGRQWHRGNEASVSSSHARLPWSGGNTQWMASQTGAESCWSVGSLLQVDMSPNNSDIEISRGVSPIPKHITETGRSRMRVLTTLVCGGARFRSWTDRCNICRSLRVMRLRMCVLSVAAHS